MSTETISGTVTQTHPLLYYSRTSAARTLMAHVPWLFRTHS